ncbi:hypothetical protein [Clostridium botulinum]|uniref:hypothetical protein n=1 Tax=Clostridium botulinum TaxID=1491 RepID=UPI0004CFEE22|nr:hypothetical protein [Clostridium botulinum]
MKAAIKYNEFFVKLEDETVSLEPIELADGLLIPGMLFSKLGEKERTSISMQEGYYLEYVGFVKKYKYLLFREYLQDWEGWLNALIYVSKHTLLQQTCENGFRDIRIKHLEPIINPKPKIGPKQLCMF